MCIWLGWVLGTQDLCGFMWDLSCGTTGLQLWHTDSAVQQTSLAAHSMWILVPDQDQTLVPYICKVGF